MEFKLSTYNSCASKNSIQVCYQVELWEIKNNTENIHGDPF